MCQAIQELGFHYTCLAINATVITVAALLLAGLVILVLMGWKNSRNNGD